MKDSFLIRAATALDLEPMDRLQQSSVEASHWRVEDYLAYDCLVAVEHGHAIAFLVTRQTALGEHEILNLVVEPSHRRQGIARRLLQHVLARAGDWFLEVRESNQAALGLYQSLGFETVGRLTGYYSDPPESGIVMKLRS